ncbi:hypothetical protein EHS25_005766 [Saitozyma podzolica]|uniref:Amine oxidase n=1 Tax=Saitozyma podzolica TaxID=1890683 RepID=A0A427XVW6_9TREE|nr:hypothetical protein EHS25_005766 [Saitozyma podzolica]
MAPSISDIIREAAALSVSPAPTKAARPHPLDNLSVEEINRACSIAKAKRPDERLWIKVCSLREPVKKELAPFLEAERRGETAPRPTREADVLFFVLSSRGLYEVVIDLDAGEETLCTKVDGHHAPLDREEINQARAALFKDPVYIKTVEDLKLPPGTTIVPQGWPFGSDHPDPAIRRVFFILYHRNPANDHPDSNHYAFPLPVVMFWDLWESKVTDVHWCYTGNEQDGMTLGTGPKEYPTQGCQGNDYEPSLNGVTVRTDLKPLHVTQPEGVSFKVTGQLIEWQKWRFRIGFNYREGPTLHDVCYDGRPVFYRLSLSEMHVPYADPRPPLHLKQVFDFGDIDEGGSFARGVAHPQYFDGAEVNPSGEGRVVKNVICCHEQDNGILWKHTNTPTGRAAVTRQRLLVLQTIITVGNYDYIFAWHFDQAGAIHLESRATGILSTGPINVGKKSPYGTVVSPGVLGTSHQHFINLRIDPCVDGHNNTITQDDVVPDPPSAENGHGIGFRVKSTPITVSGFADANPLANRSFKIVSATGLVPHPSQMRLAAPDAHITSRAPFTQHHIWVTSYRDGELFCAGQYTNQSRGTAGGIADWVARKDNVENTDLVLWHTFALTHIPRVEDFPVMPVEIHTISLKPNNFFTANPALDVPLSSQAFNQSSTVDGDSAATPCCAGNGL